MRMSPPAAVQRDASHYEKTGLRRRADSTYIDVPAEDLFGGLLDQVTGSCMDTPHRGYTKNR